jgi:hypothetical protein
MKAALWAVAFSRLLDRPLIQSLNLRDPNIATRTLRLLSFVRCGITPRITRRHAPLLKHDNLRVGGRVHALVGRRHNAEKTRSAQPPQLASRADN